MLKIIKRFGDICTGLVMIVLSLCVQFFFFFLLSMPVLPMLGYVGLKIESRAGEWVVFSILLLAFNGVACWEYFRKQRANVRLGSTATVIFHVPRGIDLIMTGSERVSRSTEQ
jgi:hypothetical protein